MLIHNFIKHNSCLAINCFYGHWRLGKENSKKMHSYVCVFFLYDSTANSPPPPHGLALKMSPQNPSASPVLEVAPLSPIGNFPMQNFPIGKFLMLQSGFRSGGTFPYAGFPYRGILYALVQF